MTNISKALAVALLSSAFSLADAAVFAQGNSTPPTTATRPTAPDQSSLPSTNAPPASTTQTTGEAPRDPTVKQMNEKEKDKVERGGK